MDKKTNKRPPGRPRARTGDPRADLVEIAARLFAEHGYEGTSLKQVARGAEVTPAMIAYYFRDKAGLLEAVAVSGFERMLNVLEGVVADHPEGEFVAHFIRAYLRAINERPWIPQIFVREVLSRDSPLRQLFVEEFASRAIELVPPRVAGEIARGRLRADLDPRYAMLSLLGMCVFPYIAQPVLGPLLNYQFDDTFLREYSAHAVELFFRGAGGEES
jgi:AcrR family transcriptional regulator